MFSNALKDIDVGIRGAVRLLKSLSRDFDGFKACVDPSSLDTLLASQ